MKTRTLAGTLSVAEIGYGCMGLSGTYGPAEEAEASAVLLGAVEAGVTLFDTADAYGPFTNEVLVGKVLRGVRNRLVIATKFGQRLMPDGSRTICGRPEYVRKACEDSLQRMGLEHIDLYFQHRVDKTVPIEETVGAMSDLVRTGKVRHIGLSEASAATIRRAHRVHPLTAVQSELSLWSRQDEADILPVCKELGVGYVAYSPLGRGFLTGSVDSPEALGPGDVRRMMPRFAEGNIERNRTRGEALGAFAAARGITPAQLALAWVLSRGEHIVPIPGTRSLKRLGENLAAARAALSAQDLERLDVLAPPGSTAGERYADPMMTHIER
jgi:aryl-alcohol dehydrogenase-like predicted oxidoreductase